VQNRLGASGVDGDHDLLQCLVDLRETAPSETLSNAVTHFDAPNLRV